MCLNQVLLLLLLTSSFSSSYVTAPLPSRHPSHVTCIRTFPIGKRERGTAEREAARFFTLRRAVRAYVTDPLPGHRPLPCVAERCSPSSQSGVHHAANPPSRSLALFALFALDFLQEKSQPLSALDFLKGKKRTKTQPTPLSTPCECAVPAAKRVFHDYKKPGARGSQGRVL